jgi:hypothetical protein
MTLTTVEKSVIVSALNEQIISDRAQAKLNPAVAGYAERNIKFREELIAKVENA